MSDNEHTKSSRFPSIVTINRRAAAQLELLREELFETLETVTGPVESKGTSTGSSLDPAVVTPEPPSDDDMLTGKELNKLLDKSMSWLYKQTSALSIPFYKIGGENRFKLSKIRAWIDEKAREDL